VRRGLSVVIAVLLKDLRAEIRSRETLVSMGAFALLTVVVFGLSFEPWFAAEVGGVEGERFAEVVAPGLLWIAFAFAGVLGLNRSFALERESGAIYGLMLAPADRGAIYLGKTFANALFMLVVEGLVFPVFVLLFNLDVWQALPRLAPVGILGALAFSAAGTVFAAVAGHTSMRDIMLPFLLFPATAPVLVGAVEASGAALRGSAEGYAGGLRLVAAFAVIYLTVSYLLFDYVLEE